MKIPNPTVKPTRSIPPYSARTAEKHLHKARLYADNGAWADALAELGRALDIAPALQHDPTALDLAARLTAHDQPRRAIALIAQPAYRVALIRQLAPPYKRFYIPFSRGVAFVCLVLLAVLTTLPHDGQTIFSQFFAAVQLRQWKSEQHATVGATYYLVRPSGSPPASGWPGLALLTADTASADAHLALFAPRAHQSGVLLAVVHIAPNDAWPTALDSILQQLGADPAAPRQGFVLFGHGASANAVSQFAQSRPNRLGGAIMSGASFLYPPPSTRPRFPYLIIYGSRDPILTGSTATRVSFTEIDEWETDFQYLVIPNVGAELTTHHADLVFDLLADIYTEARD